MSLSARGSADEATPGPAGAAACGCPEAGAAGPKTAAARADSKNHFFNITNKPEPEE
ncbi:hypothetical protein FACS189460_1800 [Deltaproteobacteria bacterium]|nr:hypothetical protein FACS189460_1800 [Deltaproteobacteria bacterium]